MQGIDFLLEGTDVIAGNIRHGSKNGNYSCNIVSLNPK